MSARTEQNQKALEQVLGAVQEAAAILRSEIAGTISGKPVMGPFAEIEAAKFVFANAAALLAELRQIPEAQAEPVPAVLDF